MHRCDEHSSPESELESEEDECEMLPKKVKFARNLCCLKDIQSM